MSDWKQDLEEVVRKKKERKNRIEETKKRQQAFLDLVANAFWELKAELDKHYQTVEVDDDRYKSPSKISIRLNNESIEEFVYTIELHKEIKLGYKVVIQYRDENDRLQSIRSHEEGDNGYVMNEDKVKKETIINNFIRSFDNTQI